MSRENPEIQEYSFRPDDEEIKGTNESRESAEKPHEDADKSRNGKEQEARVASVSGRDRLKLSVEVSSTADRREGERRQAQQLEKADARASATLEKTSEIGELDLSSPEKIFNAYSHLGDIETKFIEETQALYTEFDEAQGNIKAAIEEGRKGDFLDWIKSKFKDNETRTRAERSLKSIRKKYQDAVNKNKKRVE